MVKAAVVRCGDAAATAMPGIMTMAARAGRRMWESNLRCLTGRHAQMMKKCACSCATRNAKRATFQVVATFAYKSHEKESRSI